MDLVKHASAQTEYMFNHLSMPISLLSWPTKSHNSKLGMDWTKKRMSLYFSVTQNLNFNRTHGPLIHARAVEKVQRHLDEAVSRGAQVLVGGTKLEGNFFAPTVVVDVPSDVKCVVDDVLLFDPSETAFGTGV